MRPRARCGSVRSRGSRREKPLHECVRARGPTHRAEVEASSRPKAWPAPPRIAKSAACAGVSVQGSTQTAPEQTSGAGHALSEPQSGREHWSFRQTYGAGQSAQERGRQYRVSLIAAQRIPALQSWSRAHSRWHVPKKHSKPPSQDPAPMQFWHRPPGASTSQYWPSPQSADVRHVTGPRSVITPASSLTLASRPASSFQRRPSPRRRPPPPRRLRRFPRRSRRSSRRAECPHRSLLNPGRPVRPSARPDRRPGSSTRRSRDSECTAKPAQRAHRRLFIRGAIRTTFSLGSKRTRLLKRAGASTGLEKGARRVAATHRLSAALCHGPPARRRASKPTRRFRLPTPPRWRAACRSASGPRRKASRPRRDALGAHRKRFARNPFLPASNGAPSASGRRSTARRRKRTAEKNRARAGNRKLHASSGSSRARIRRPDGTISTPLARRRRLPASPKKLTARKNFSHASFIQ